MKTMTKSKVTEKGPRLEEMKGELGILRNAPTNPQGRTTESNISSISFISPIPKW